MPTLWKIQAGDTIPTDCCHSDGSGFFRDCERAMRLTAEHTLDTLRATDSMRLDAEEAAALAAALAGEHGEAWLFGSRLDPARRGGDIDVLVLTEEPAFETSQRISTRFFSRCEEKIDVVVMNPARLTAEQADFLARNRKARIA